MALIDTFMKQDAIYWAPTGRDSYGDPTYADPIPIKCRWTNQRSSFLNASGEKQVSDAMVFVDRDVELFGLLMLGELTDVVGNPPDVRTNNPNVGEVRYFQKIPDFNAKKFLRKVFL